MKNNIQVSAEGANLKYLTETRAEEAIIKTVATRKVKVL